MSSIDEQRDELKKLLDEYEAMQSVREKTLKAFSSNLVGPKTGVTLEDEMREGNIKPRSEWASQDHPSEWRVRNLISRANPDRDAKDLSPDEQKYWESTFDETASSCATAYLRS